MGASFLFTLLFSLFTLFSSCSSEQKRTPDTYVSETTYIDADTTAYTLEETGGDTLLVGSSPYHDTMQALESYHDRWESVASPDMLQTVLATYENDIQELKEKMKVKLTKKQKNSTGRVEYTDSIQTSFFD